jgi:dTDP-4-dehydrorhamnose 3,5-epimerase
MKYIAEKLEGVYSLIPDIYEDNRGYFFESFNPKEFEKNVGIFNVVQENESRSKCRVLRGLHYQLPPYNQAKLVRVVKGIILDVIIDLRTDSDTYGKILTFLLTDYDNTQLYIPRGFAHGFVAISKNVRFQYKVDNAYAPKHDSGIFYDDSYLNIDWEVYDPIVSEKDMKLPHMREVQHYTKVQWERNP